MNIYTLLMIIPVVLAVALIIMIVRRNITENSGRGIDIAPAIPAVVVLMIAILVIAPMAESTQDYIFDEDSGKLTINKNIPQLAVQPWDDYADEVKTLVIKDGVEIGSNVFDSLTSLEYVEIGEDVSLGLNAFSIPFQDPYAQTPVAPEGEYVNIGNVLCEVIDPAMLRIGTASGHISIGGFSAGVTGVKNLVIPVKSNAGTDFDYLGYIAFKDNTDLVRVGFAPGSKVVLSSASPFNGCTGLLHAELPEAMEMLATSAFNGCANLISVTIPDTMESIDASAFTGCASLRSVDLSKTELTAITQALFSGCTSLTTVSVPDGLETIGPSAFSNCTALTSFVIPDSVTSVGFRAFEGCTGVTSVHVGTGLAEAADLSSPFTSWTFYGTDGETVLQKTGANLAGKTFQGTAAALVEVAAGTLSLTPQQLQMVHLHDAELQDLQSQPISLDPLPFQPSLQTEQEQETA